MTETWIRDEAQQRPPHTAVINDNSTITNQVGVIHGDQNVYQVSQEASPKEKFNRGVNCLDGRMARQAESHIHEAVLGGYRSPKVSYYWALAILSGKSFNHLRKEDIENLDYALECTTGYPSDEWSAPLRFLTKLVTYLRSQDPDPADLTTIEGEYHGLASARQAEIQRHIETILTEAAQDHTELVNNKDAYERRMQNSRRHRAWKFFEPTPRRPEKRTAQPSQIKYYDWISLGAGALLGLTGMTWELLLLFDRAPAYGTFVAVVIGASAYVIVKYSLDQFTLRHRQVVNERERLAFLRDSGVLGPASADSPASNTQFMDSIATLITYYFEKCRPKEAEKPEWETKTLGIKRDLHFQLTKLYRSSGADANSLKWLIRWHAKEVAKSWDSIKPTSPRNQRRPALPRLIRGVGWTTLIPSILIALAIAASADLTGAFFATLLTTVGYLFALPGAVHAYSEGRRHAIEKQEYTELYRSENQEYQRWRTVLEDRPSDLEMAQWLDFDKAHIKSLAMSKYQVTGRDIIAHATLTESTPQHRHARVPSGPFRYSRYQVHVFLLTEGGVRQMSIGLDFTTGNLSNIRGKIFRYDSIASAGIAEVEARFYGRQRLVKTSDDPAEVGAEKTPSSVVITQALRLSLVDAQTIDILFEGFDEAAANPLGDTEDLRERSQDASGATDALRILEAVAAEGKEWLERERARHHRRLADYRAGHSTDLVNRGASTGASPKRNHKKPATQPAVDGHRTRRKQVRRQASSADASAVETREIVKPPKISKRSGQRAS